MKEVNPQETSRTYAFETWMNVPMPMVTFFKTLNVSRLVKTSWKPGMKFNMLMYWCAGKTARSVKEFYLLLVNDKLMQYDTIAVNIIVANRKGEVSSYDVPFCDDLSLLNQHYLQLAKQVAESCVNHDLTENMVIGTSALAQYEIDGIAGMCSGILNNPLLIRDKYKRRLTKTTLTVSFQFHHMQMDETHASRFSDGIQKEVNQMKIQLKTTLENKG